MFIFTYEKGLLIKMGGVPCMRPIHYYEDDDFVINEIDDSDDED